MASAVIYSVLLVASMVCWGLVLGPCFVLQYFVSFLVLQSSCWGLENWLLYFCCVLNVMSQLSFFDSSSRRHDLVWSYLLTFYQIDKGSLTIAMGKCLWFQ